MRRCLPLIKLYEELQKNSAREISGIHVQIVNDDELNEGGVCVFA